MKKIGWIKIKGRKYGESFYEEEAQRILAENYDLEIIEVDSRFFKKGYLRAPELVFRLANLAGQKDLWIRGFYPALTLPFDKTRGKNLVIVHHIDFSLSQGLAKIFDKMIEKLFWFSAKKAEAILTVSEYWKNNFLDRGFRNVFKINNAFDVKEFDIAEAEVESFKKEQGLLGKPIIYLGNCQAQKGVREAYEVLKDPDYYLVTSGEKFCDLPAKNFDLPYRDYLKLLKSSSVVLAMSKVKEGWCRSAHEAMLLKVPVIGLGLGGQRELLEGGKQIICPNFSGLKEKVEYVLEHPEIGEDGFNFAKNFTKEKFKNDWLNLIRELTE